MRRQFPILLIALNAVCSPHLQPAIAAPPNTQSAPQIIYYAGPDLIAPELLPAAVPLEKASHCKKRDGIAKVLTIVDPMGNPIAPAVFHPSGIEFDDFAVGLVAGDRFKPGTHEGKPARIWVEVDLHLQVCVVKPPKGSDDDPTIFLSAQPQQTVTVLPPPVPLSTGTLRSVPVRSPESGLYSASSSVSAPIPLNSVEAHYTQAARKARINGVCLVTVIVDANGMPQLPRVIKSLRPDLDDQALKAVLQYRFKPAMRADTPVPVIITVEINFRLY